MVSWFPIWFLMWFPGSFRYGFRGFRLMVSSWFPDRAETVPLDLPNGVAIARDIVGGDELAAVFVEERGGALKVGDGVD